MIRHLQNASNTKEAKKKKKNRKKIKETVYRVRGKNLLIKKSLISSKIKYEKDEGKKTTLLNTIHRTKKGS